MNQFNLAPNCLVNISSKESKKSLFFWRITFEQKRMKKKNEKKNERK